MAKSLANEKRSSLLNLLDQNHLVVSVVIPPHERERRQDRLILSQEVPDDDTLQYFSRLREASGFYRSR